MINKYKFYNPRLNEITDEVLVADFIGENIVHQQGLNDFIRMVEVAGFKPLRYTGITDVNGKEVYENFIVKRTCLDPKCPIEHIGVVKYSEKWAMWGIDDGVSRDEVDGYLAPLAYGVPAKKMILGVQIVGDIYTTPNLLKK